MKVFFSNRPDKDKQYVLRTWAYAVIANEEKQIAIVKTKTGYFLPGGGVENGESFDNCLKRECIEEIGAEISIINRFAQGNYYFYSTTLNVDMESIGFFFECKILKFLNVNTEAEHELIWLDTKKAIELLYLENQKEAIRIYQSKQ